MVRESWRPTRLRMRGPASAGSKAKENWDSTSPLHGKLGQQWKNGVQRWKTGTAMENWAVARMCIYIYIYIYVRGALSSNS